MAQYVVLVNGLPGAGKSTLAGALGPLLGIPVISKDTLKEAMAAAAPGVPAAAVGPVAAGSMWDLAGAVPGGVLLESWWFRPRDRGFAEAGLRRAGATTAVEVWCDLPAGLALDRVRQRDRGDLYDDDRHVREFWDRWAAEAEPLGIGEVLTVRTDQPVDHAALARRLSTAVEGTVVSPPVRTAAAVARPPAPLPNAAAHPH
ncbi:AAA family ATPase [Paractinoplanes rishiriensis]|uniref:Kinase n=1 Tax=Paractinoplanes rishiriensis TaxID=1050105 RepID=A0A919MT22_9ACTN|nr:AAA family ATPase [Actinoplanes rishiriensis]GIE98811.1 hypothetical protein Ari01nite_62760 [Actinoplanes rishiriensis]